MYFIVSLSCCLQKKSAHIKSHKKRDITSVLSYKCIEKVIPVTRYIPWPIYRLPYKHPFYLKIPIRSANINKCRPNFHEVKCTGGRIKCTSRKIINIFLNGEGVFLGHSRIMIKWTCGFFPKICNLIPVYNYTLKSRLLLPYIDQEEKDTTSKKHRSKLYIFLF